MPSYKLLISYDGTEFGGWQIQPNAPSIQEEIEKALATFCREEVRITGSGRTDSGVHALGQVAHFKIEKNLSQRDLLSLNALLPSSIYLREIQPVSDDFHARKSAISKIYSYHIFLGKNPGPFIRRYVSDIWDPLDLGLLKKGAELFIGEHDFASFANVCKTRIGKSSVRTIYSLEVGQKGSHITLTFQGNGFLYKMVRNLTGALLLVSSGKLSLDELKVLMDQKKRTRTISPAPAKGLFLEKVIYEENGRASDSERKLESDGDQIAPFLRLKSLRS